VIGFALASPGEAEQFLLRVGKAAFASDLVQPGRQLSVMRAVQLPPIGVIIAHRNSAAIPTRTSAAVMIVTTNRNARQFFSRSQPGKLHLDEFEIVSNRVQVAAGLSARLARRLAPAR
jgi:hypothetical protein